MAWGFVKVANKPDGKCKAIAGSPSGSQTSSASSLSTITEPSRPSTQDSAVAAPNTLRSLAVSVASPIVIKETSKCLCEVCGKYGICGCARRANSSRSNRNKDFGFCTDTEFDLALKGLPPKDASTQHEGTAWQGYRSTLANEDQSQDTPSDNLAAAKTLSSALVTTEDYPLSRNEMIGAGRYRCSKEASEEFIINNTIEKLGDVADLIVKLGGEDLKVHGHETLTYADVLRIKQKRAGQNNPNAYREEVSSDGVIKQFGFPTQPVPLDPASLTVPKHLRSGSWTDHDQTARDFNMVHNYGQYGELGCRSRFNYPIPKRELETVKKPSVRFGKAPAAATRRLHGMEVAPDAGVGILPDAISCRPAKIPDAAQLGTAPPARSYLPALDEDARALFKRQ